MVWPSKTSLCSLQRGVCSTLQLATRMWHVMHVIRLALWQLVESMSALPGCATPTLLPPASVAVVQ